MKGRDVGDVIAMIAVVAGIMMLSHPGTGGPGLIDAMARLFETAAGNAIGGQVSGQTPAQAERTLAATRFFGATDAERAALIGQPGASVNASPGIGGGFGGGNSAGGNVPFGPGLPG
jgi:hypothetical protein